MEDNITKEKLIIAVIPVIASLVTLIIQSIITNINNKRKFKNVMLV